MKMRQQQQQQQQRRQRQRQRQRQQQRRRQRMLRSLWRHEQMAIKLALAEKLHTPLREPYCLAEEGGRGAGLRPTGTEASQGGARHAVPFLCRPEPVREPQLQARVQRHTMEQRIEHTPYMQILDAPVPQKVEQLWISSKIWTLMFLCRSSKYPRSHKILSLSGSVDLVPQMAEQLVEVPTVLPRASLCRSPESRSSGNIQFLMVWGGKRSFPFPCFSRLWSSTSTFQFLVVEGDTLVFKVFTPNRVQQRRLLLWNAFLSGLSSRSLTFLLLVVALDWVLPHLLVCRFGKSMGFSHFSPWEEKCGVRSRPESQGARQCQLMDSGGL